MLLFLSGQYLSICAITVSREAVSFYALRLPSHSLYSLLAEEEEISMAKIMLWPGG
jgi:hypothetical protein